MAAYVAAGRGVGTATFSARELPARCSSHQSTRIRGITVLGSVKLYSDTEALADASEAERYVAVGATELGRGLLAQQDILSRQAKSKL